MTAFSRLWSRAPLWRGALLLGLGMTGLAALYPPAGGQASLPAARYDPPPAPAPPVSLPPQAMQPLPAAPPGVRPDAPSFGSTVSAAVPFAGETVPLPAGDWVTVAAIGGKTPGGKALNAAMLAQLAGGQVAAIAVLHGFGLPGEAGAGFPRVPSCQETRNIYSRVFVARDNGEQACWSVDAVALAWADPANRLLASGAAELQQRGAAMPEVAVRASFVRADQSHVLIAEIYQPVDTPPEGPGGWNWSRIMATPDRLARMTRLRDWAAAWWPLFDRGFSNHLDPAAVTPLLARMPL